MGKESKRMLCRCVKRFKHAWQEDMRTCFASVGEDRFQQKSAGQRLVKGTNLLTRQTQSDDLSVSL